MKWRILASKFHELIARNQFVLYLAIFCLAFFCYLWFAASPSLTDPDSFYHLKMVKLVAERGAILDFPWLQFTVLKDYYIDHHFLYHVAAVPFVKVMGDFVGFKYFTAFLAAAFVFLSYWIFKKDKLRWPEFFALLLLFIPALMFRISLGKAIAFSLIILFLGIYCIFNKKYWSLFVISFVYVWSYGGFLLLPAMAIIYMIADSIHRAFLPEFEIKRKYWARFKAVFLSFFKNLSSSQNLKLAASSFGGIISGVIINPYFPKNLNFIWQQLVQIGLINFQGKVNVGGEWYPYDPWQLFMDINLAMIIGFLAYVAFICTFKKQQTKSYFFLLTSCLFLILTLKSKRYVEYFAPFLVFFSAYSFTFAFLNVKGRAYLENLKKYIYWLKYLLAFGLIYIVIIAAAFFGRNAWLTKKAFNGGISFNNYAGVSTYLKNNAQPGQIIMHTDWDDFPMLFYQNEQNYYIVGLDPTFMYNYDRDLYKLYADITTAKKIDNLAAVIKEKFRAGYFIVNKDRLQLRKNLENDGGFDKVYEDGECWLFKLK